jgi:hypothetical protein
MWKFCYHFFDKLEDRIRGRLSRKPILYAFIGGFGVVLFWRGVWHVVDTFMYRNFAIGAFDEMNPLAELSYFDGFLSLFVGSTILLLTGLFVSNFIGNEILISGIRGEKKTVDKSKKEIMKEHIELEHIEQHLKKISKQLSVLQKKK